MSKAIAMYSALILAGVIIALLFFTPLAYGEGLAARRARAVNEARLEMSR